MPDSQRGAPPNREMRKRTLVRRVNYSREGRGDLFRDVGLVGNNLNDSTTTTIERTSACLCFYHNISN